MMMNSNSFRVSRSGSSGNAGRGMGMGSFGHRGDGGNRARRCQFGSSAMSRVSSSSSSSVQSAGSSGRGTGYYSVGQVEVEMRQQRLEAEQRRRDGLYEQDPNEIPRSYPTGVGRGLGLAFTNTPSANIFTSIGRPDRPSSGFTGLRSNNMSAYGSGSFPDDFNRTPSLLGPGPGMSFGQGRGRGNQSFSAFNDTRTMGLGAANDESNIPSLPNKSINSGAVPRSFVYSNSNQFERNDRNMRNRKGAGDSNDNFDLYDDLPPVQNQFRRKSSFQRNTASAGQKQFLRNDVNNYETASTFYGKSKRTSVVDHDGAEGIIGTDSTDNPFDFVESAASRRGGGVGGGYSFGNRRGRGGIRINQTEKDNFRIPNRNIGRSGSSAAGQSLPIRSTEEKKAKVGIHLDISPSILQVMEKHDLGDKVFVMIPNKAKSVTDVKLHISRILGVDKSLFSVFVNGFRIPESENVDAFACLSRNSLVQIVKLGDQPPVDFSKFVKVLSPKKRRMDWENMNSGEDEIDKQNKDEPSLLDPPTKRGRYSVASDSDFISSKPTSSPSKSEVIEIVLSDDEEEENDGKMFETNDTNERTSLSPGKLVIEETGNETQHDFPDKLENMGKDINDKSTLEEETEQSSIYGDVGVGNKLKPSNKKKKKGTDGKVSNLGENWDEVVVLSSQESETDDSGGEDNESSVSTNFDENSNDNEPFFTITAVHSIPIGSFQGDENEHEHENETSDDPNDKSQQQQKTPNPLAETVHQNSSLTLLNPFANKTTTAGPSSVVTVDISDDVQKDEENENSTQEDDIKTQLGEADTNNLTVISDISQIPNDALILLQNSDQTSAVEEDWTSTVTQLSGVKYCRLIGKCGQKLTLEPILEEDYIDKTDVSDEVSCLSKKFVFVDFNDLLTLNPAIVRK